MWSERSSGPVAINAGERPGIGSREMRVRIPSGALNGALEDCRVQIDMRGRGRKSNMKGGESMAKRRVAAAGSGAGMLTRQLAAPIARMQKQVTALNRPLAQMQQPMTKLRRLLASG